METERLIIRRFHVNDREDLYVYLSQEETVKYEPYEIFKEEEFKREALKRAGSGSFWAVCLKSSAKLIGNIYLEEKGFEAWELGYVFNADFLGQGYAIEAVRALIDYAVREKTARIVAMCNPLNERSLKLLERVGMRKEGLLLQNIYFKKDEQGFPIWQDTCEYAILRGEWIK